MKNRRKIKKRPATTLVKNGKDTTLSEFKRIDKGLEDALKLTLKVDEIELLFDAKPNSSIAAQTGFILICARDLIASVTAYLGTNADWSKRFHIRQSILQMFEIGNKIDVVIGKEFRSQFENDDTYRVGFCEVIKSKKELNIFRNEHGKELRIIRDSAAGHLDCDSNQLHSTIMDIQLDYFHKMSVKFLRLIAQFLGSLNSVFSVRIDQLISSIRVNTC